MWWWTVIQRLTYIVLIFPCILFFLCCEVRLKRHLWHCCKENKCSFHWNLNSINQNVKCYSKSKLNQCILHVHADANSYNYYLTYGELHVFEKIIMTLQQQMLLKYHSTVLKTNIFSLHPIPYRWLEFIHSSDISFINTSY